MAKYKVDDLVIVKDKGPGIVVYSETEPFPDYEVYYDIYLENSHTVSIGHRHFTINTVTEYEDNLILYTDMSIAIYG